ncbi:hypothetical protein GGI07_004380 [Coemansia sp. Benny D115]|nr:hypothetical protein GGI07_004380 [Coemansia sp. Benny D115]
MSGRQTRAEQDAVSYAKRKRQEDNDQAQATAQAAFKGAELLQQGAPSSLQNTRAALAQTVDLGLITQVTHGHTSDGTIESRRRAMAEFDRKRLARQIAVPTDDNQVRLDLRKLGHPVCLFGEDAGDRRDRLRYHLSVMAMEKQGDKRDAMQTSSISDGGASEDEDEEDREEEEEFYTEGSETLLQTRRHVAESSLSRAQHRISWLQRQSQADAATIRKQRLSLCGRLGSYTICGSQVGDSRPLGSICFTRDSQSLLVSSWSGSIKLWSVPQLTSQRTFRGHTERVSALSTSPDTETFATGDADGRILLWTLQEETPRGELLGHQGRVSRVAHHPDARLLASASYDGSWRLWDMQTQQEVLLQEGHSREVFTVRIQCDGALLASAGLDGVARIWDLRSGKSIATIQGHAKEIFAMDWAPNGYQLATGAADNTIRIFDLRAMQSAYEIPAHKSIVTDLKFFHDNQDLNPSADCGQYMASSSNDGLVSVWSAGDWKLQRSLAGHVGKVLGVDIAPNGSYIASAGYDRTFKLWGPDDILDV